MKPLSGVVVPHHNFALSCSVLRRSERVFVFLVDSSVLLVVWHFQIHFQIFLCAQDLRYFLCYYIDSGVFLVVRHFQIHFQNFLCVQDLRGFLCSTVDSS